MNNDIEMITEDWLEEMLGTCQRREVGVVGAKLYYPDDTVQHAGIVVGIGGNARGIGQNMFMDCRERAADTCTRRRLRWITRRSRRHA